MIVEDSSSRSLILHQYFSVIMWLIFWSWTSTLLLGIPIGKTLQKRVELMRSVQQGLPVRKLQPAPEELTRQKRWAQIPLFLRLGPQMSGSACAQRNSTGAAGERANATGKEHLCEAKDVSKGCSVPAYLAAEQGWRPCRASRIAGMRVMVGACCPAWVPLA